MNIYVSGYGRHRRPSLFERAISRPVALLLVAAGVGFCTSGLIEFLRLVK